MRTLPAFSCIFKSNTNVKEMKQKTNVVKYYISGLGPCCSTFPYLAVSYTHTTVNLNKSSEFLNNSV